MKTEYSKLLAEAKNPLVLAVGGGNDSVSTLLIQKQLQASFGYFPKKINVAAMLPDCLDYEHLGVTGHHLVGIINENTQRYVQGKLMTAFPERILSMNKNVIPTLPIENVYGLSMKDGSIGIASALKYLCSTQVFDLVLAMDVGGDFIAVPENVEVLSPMMDGYMMYALKHLYANDEQIKVIPIIYGVFGLGTDGETTPGLLREALIKVNPSEGDFTHEDVVDVIDFYRKTVEPNRYSRTTDFTMKEIEGVAHDNPAQFRGRFHVKTAKGEKSKVNYGVFEHVQDSEFFGKYYLFNDVSKIENPFAIQCENGIEWFVNVQNSTTKINHELNGQSYEVGLIIEGLKPHTYLFFGTPSRKFNSAQQADIAIQIAESIKNEVYDIAIVYKDQFDKFIEFSAKPISNDLLLVGKSDELVSKVEEKLRAYLSN